MANPTVTTTSTLTWVDANGNVITASGSKATTQVGTTAAQFVQIIGTTTEVLVFPSDSVPPGRIFLKNLDPTNFISVDLNTPVVPGSTAFLKIFPGEEQRITTLRTTIYALADTSPCNLQITIAPV